MNASERSAPVWSSGATGGVGFPTDVLSHAKETKTSGLRIGLFAYIYIYMRPKKARNPRERSIFASRS